MRNLFYFLLLLGLSPTLVASEHGGTIKGVVVSASDNTLLSGATVQLVELKLYAATNEIGTFLFPDLQDGDYTVRVSYIGHTPKTQGIRVSNHETSNVKIELEEAALNLGDVEVLAQSNDPMQALSQLDIRLRPLQSSQDIRRWLGDRAANEDYSLTAAGYLLVDAQLAYTPLLGSKRPLELSISAQNLGNVAWKEAQFETESRLRGEAAPVSEIHFTPGTPFNFKAGLTFRF
jgi:hypothetical protein